MNETTSDRVLSFSPLPIPGGQVSDRASLNGIKATARASEPQRRTGVRLAVLSLVALVSFSVLAVGTSWAYYRWQHTVIHDARVKGRVYKIGARMEGQVKSVEVEPGQRVTKGDVLVRLEDGHIVAAVHEAEAKVQAAVKRLEVEKLGIAQARRQLALDIERADGGCTTSTGDLEAAISLRDKWEQEYTRVASLIQTHMASKSDLDNALAQRDNARALVKAAAGKQTTSDAACRLARTELDGLHVREAGLAVLSAEVELARQQLALAQADLAATVMRAPDDGWVIDRIVEPGGSARVGEPMMSLWLGAPWIEAWVDEKKLGGIKIGSAVDITLTAFPNRKLRGSVETIGVLADKELEGAPVPATLHAFFVPNSMVPIRIAVPESPVRLQPGLTAVVGIRDSASSGPAPQTAPQTAHGETFLDPSPLFAGERAVEFPKQRITSKKPN